MSHTYTSTLFHVVFSTKERRRAIAEPPKLWAYVAGVARNLRYDALAVGGTENHVHILLRLPGQIAVAEAVQKLKSNSSRWLRENGNLGGMAGRLRRFFCECVERGRRQALHPEPARASSAAQLRRRVSSVADQVRRYLQ